MLRWTLKLNPPQELRNLLNPAFELSFPESRPKPLLLADVWAEMSTQNRFQISFSGSAPRAGERAVERALGLFAGVANGNLSRAPGENLEPKDYPPTTEQSWSLTFGRSWLPFSAERDRVSSLRLWNMGLTKDLCSVSCPLWRFLLHFSFAHSSMPCEAGFLLVGCFAEWHVPACIQTFSGAGCTSSGHQLHFCSGQHARKAT